jgi:hypothetical protein
MSPVTEPSPATKTDTCGDSPLSKIASVVGIINFVLWAVLLYASFRWWIRQDIAPCHSDFDDTHRAMRALQIEWNLTEFMALRGLRGRVDRDLDKVIECHHLRRMVLSRRMKELWAAYGHSHDAWSRLFLPEVGRRFTFGGIMWFLSRYREWFWAIFEQPRLVKLHAEVLATHRELNLLSVWTV